MTTSDQQKLLLAIVDRAKSHWYLYRNLEEFSYIDGAIPCLFRINQYEYRKSIEQSVHRSS